MSEPNEAVSENTDPESIEKATTPKEKFGVDTHTSMMDGSSSSHVFLSIHMSDSFIHAFSGAMGGFMSGIATCPLDVIKTKLQAQGAFRKALVEGGKASTGVIYKGFRGSVGTIWREEGLRGFYRGLGPIVMGYLPTWGVYFYVYEGLKKRLERKSKF
jgi:hypothetical protein